MYGFSSESILIAAIATTATQINWNSNNCVGTAQRDKWKRKWPIENEQVQTTLSKLETGGNFWVDHISLNVQLTCFFFPILLPSFKKYIIVFEHESPVIIVDIIASRMDIMTFGSDYFAKQISNSWTLFRSFHVSSPSVHTLKKQHWQWQRQRNNENHCRPTITYHTIRYAVNKLTFSLLLNVATLFGGGGGGGGGSWQKPPEVRFNCAFIIIIIIIINFETDVIRDSGDSALHSP